MFLGVQGYLLKRYAWTPRAGVFLVEWLFYVFIDVFHQKQPALASVVCDIPAASLRKAYFSRGRISRVRCTAVMFEATCVIIYTT